MMQERIIINIVRPEVGVEYQPATSEAEITDMAAAIELGLHALAQKAVEIRREIGRGVPPVMEALVQAHSYKDFDY
jgi:hypothetical protein